jgi:hypothetical protein
LDVGEWGVVAGIVAAVGKKSAAEAGSLFGFSFKLQL